MTSLPASPICTIAWIGLDVASKSFVAALDLPWVPGTEQVGLHDLPARLFPRTAEGAQACLAWAREQLLARGLDPFAVRLRAAMEATGPYSVELLFWLTEADAALCPAIINPKQSADYLRSRSVRRKDDLTDARGIARFATERSPAGADTPTGPQKELREILRLRLALVVEREAYKDRLAKLPAQSGKDVRRILEKHVRGIERLIADCEKAADVILRKDKAMARDVAKLKEIFGVGELTAMTVVAELGDLRRFSSPGQLACFCGVTPKVHESGEHRGRETVSNMGNRYMRRSLFMCTSVIYRFNKCAIGAWYHRKVAQGMIKMKAHVGAMRKLLTVMWTLINRDVPYERFPQIVHKGAA